MEKEPPFYLGVVEDRMDPLMLGRVRVRVLGLHTHDKVSLPTEDLPWAYKIQHTSSGSISGIGHAPVGVVEGTWVLVQYIDPDKQMPFVVGTIGGFSRDPAINPSDTTDQQNAPANDTTSTQPPVETTTETTTSATTTVVEIPTTPPPGSVSNTSAASAGIAALLSAANEAGFTKEQKCALLGIVGGECKWIPVSESHIYSNASRLASLFSAFGGDVSLAEQYTNGKKTKEEFFEFVYGYQSRKGRELGNTAEGDGGKYYGRGFIQLTGKSNYAYFASKSGVDILNNPDLLNSDIDASAKVAVAFLKDRVKGVSPSADPGYFNAASAAVNRAYQSSNKVAYYQYFYGSAAETPTEKSAADSTVVDSTTQNGNTTGTGSGGLYGFADPNGKYPLKSLYKEPDTNRLARGVSSGTIVKKKDDNRVKGVSIAPTADGATFTEPASPFGAKYPFNQVFETESGHVQEFDDTPDYERVHIAHRKGTFIEIDANGSEVHHIVGDSYHIIDRNGSIYIAGECNLTVGGAVNILCQSSANIEVAGHADMRVGGDMDIAVKGDMKVAVGGAYTLNAKGDMNMTVGGKTNINSAGNAALDAPRVDINHGESSAKNLEIPSIAPIVGNTFDYLVAPAQLDAEIAQIEDEEQMNSDYAKAVLKEKENRDGPTDAPPAEVDTEKTEATGGTNITVPASCELIYAREVFDANYKLSANVSLGMLFDGGFNRQHRLQAQAGLSIQQLVCNMSQLANNIIEPAGAVLGWSNYGKTWKINSGFRNLGGVNSPTSDHPLGRACDIAYIRGAVSNRAKAHYDLAVQLEKILPYDQIILEYSTGDSNWVHIGYRGQGTSGPGAGSNRKMAFTMRVPGGTYPRPGASGFYLL